MSGELVYLEVRALRYIQSWPKVSDMDAMQVYRLHTAGLIQTYKQKGEIKHESGAVMDDWSGHESTLTTIGQAVFFYFSTMGGFSYASIPMLLDLWPLSSLTKANPKATAFLELFRSAWNDTEVKEYLAARKEEIRYTGLKPDTENPLSGRLVKDSPHADLFLTPAVGEEPDFSVAHVDDLNDPVLKHLATPEGAAEFAKANDAMYSREDEIAAIAEKALPVSPFETIKCEYCEGTRLDPFEDGQPCPVCLERETMPARYFYHPESSSLFVSHDPNYTPGDGLVEEVTEEQAKEIKARLEAEEADLGLKPVVLAAPVDDEPDFGLPEEEDWDIA